MTSPNDEQRITITSQDDGVLVKGDGLADGAWHGRRVDDKRLLLFSDDAKFNLPTVSGMASCTNDVFRDFLRSLQTARWSGVVAVDSGYGLKRVFFSRGAIVFAASSIMDDRLGEVIYREAKITLDEWANSAAQVTKVRKFGQVLLSSGIFTNVQLWDALKLQVRQILRSLFMVDRIFFELQDGVGLAPTEVVFEESTDELIGECYSFGCAFRAFLGKLRAESEVVVLMSSDERHAKYEAGTFVGDLLALASEQPNVQELLNTSKLIDNYTVAALLALVNSGLCRIAPEIESKQRLAPEAAPLKTKIDAYGYVLHAVRKGFADARKDFPARDVASFTAAQNPPGFPSLFVDDTGELGKESVGSLLSQCATDFARVEHFVVRLEAMIQFLLQLAGDNLEFTTAKKIRQDYRSVSA